MEGPQNDLPLYASYLPLKTPSDVAFYGEFLKAVSVQVQEVTELLTLGVFTKNLPAKCSLDGVAEQCQDLVDTSGAPFAAPLDKADPPLDPATVASFKDIIAASVVPAFASLKSFLEETYVPALSETDTASSDRHPHGQEFYAACLKFHTTTDLSPQQVHDMGLAEVSRITTSMEAIAAEENFPDLKAYVEHLKADPSHAAASGSELLIRYRDICSRIQPELLKLFHVSVVTFFTINSLQNSFLYLGYLSNLLRYFVSYFASFPPSVYVLTGQDSPSHALYHRRDSRSLRGHRSRRLLPRRHRRARWHLLREHFLHRGA